MKTITPSLNHVLKTEGEKAVKKNKQKRMGKRKWIHQSEGNEQK